MQAVVIFSVPRLEWHGEWPLFELTRINAGGQNAATIRVISELLKSSLGPWPDMALAK